jgi:hypothetical protein
MVVYQQVAECLAKALLAWLFVGDGLGLYGSDIRFKGYGSGSDI